jgi:ABC-type antimicrobial peptide transport system permease subunit
MRAHRTGRVEGDQAAKARTWWALRGPSLFLFVASAAALVVVSLAAAAMPARRAARVGIAEILRDE